MTKEEYAKLTPEEQEEHLSVMANWYRHMDSEQAGADLPPYEKYYQDLKDSLEEK